MLWSHFRRPHLIATLSQAPKSVVRCFELSGRSTLGTLRNGSPRTNYRSKWWRTRSDMQGEAASLIHFGRRVGPQPSKTQNASLNRNSTAVATTAGHAPMNRRFIRTNAGGVRTIGPRLLVNSRRRLAIPSALEVTAGSASPDFRTLIQDHEACWIIYNLCGWPTRSAH
jgi:hypothetical protein